MFLPLNLCPPTSPMERTQSSLTAHMLLLESNHSEIFKATRGQDKGKISMAKFRMHI